MSDPTTPILDSGFGLDSDPVSGWATPISNAAFGQASLQRFSNAITTDIDGVNAPGVFDTNTGGTNNEVYATMTAPLSNEAGVLMSTTDDTFADCYVWGFDSQAGALVFGSVSHSSLGTNITGIMSYSQVFSDGDSLWMQNVGTTFNLYYQSVSGGGWQLIDSVVDTLFDMTASPFFGVHTFEQAVQFTAIGGGATGITPPPPSNGSFFFALRP